MTLRKKLFLIFTLIFVLLTGVIITNHYFNQKIDDLNTKIISQEDELDVVQSLSYSVVSMFDAGGRYLVASSDEMQKTYIQVFDDHSRQVTTLLDTLRSDQSNTSYKEEFDNFETLFGDYNRELSSAFKVVAIGGKNNLGHDIVSHYFNIPAEPVVHALDDFTAFKKDDISALKLEVTSYKAYVLIIDVIIFAISFLVILGCFRYAVTHILKPIQLVESNLKELSSSKGDLTIQLPVRSKDEIGSLSKSFNLMILNLHQMVQKIATKSYTIQNATHQLSTSSSEMTASSRYISDATLIASKGAEEQVTKLGDVSSDVKATVDFVDEISISVKNVEQSAINSVNLAHQGNDTMTKMMNQMTFIYENTQNHTHQIERLHEFSETMERMLDYITSIAKKTRLLALNARIEAIHAGEYGKGFSVVADEVGKLSDESASAISNISTLVNSIKESVSDVISAMVDDAIEISNGVSLAKTSEEAFLKLKDASLEVTSQITSISESADHITSFMDAIKQDVSEVNDVSISTAENSLAVSSATEEQFAAIVSIEQSTKQLSDLTQELDLLISKFKI
jgi:methyl-accepting chemotaxis protein